MPREGDPLSDLPEPIEIDLREAEPLSVPSVSEDEPPRIDNEAVPVTLSLPCSVMASPLTGSEHITLGLDRSSAEERMPVIFSGRRGERGGDEEELSALISERTVELWEAEVIADAEPEPAEGRVDGHDLIASDDLL